MSLLKYERELLAQGYKAICGVDEVGLSPIAGPMVACAVVMNINRAKRIRLGKFRINDSKLLPREVRERLFKPILRAAFAVGIGYVDVPEINKVNNVKRCGYLARHRAVKNLGRSTRNHCHIYWHSKDQNIEYARKCRIKYVTVVPHYILVDGPFGMPEIGDIPIKSIIGGDSKSISIASASIIAKVYHDDIMMNFHKIYPHYGWNTNAGYGTTYHREMLRKYGITPYHRLHFKYVKQAFQKEIFNG